MRTRWDRKRRSRATCATRRAQRSSSSRAASAGRDPRRPPRSRSSPAVGGRCRLRLEAILFDLDDTLLVDEAAVERSLLAASTLAYARAGVGPAALARSVRERARELWRATPSHELWNALGISSWERLAADFEGGVPEMDTLRRSAAEYRREAWRRALADHGVQDAEFAEERAEAYRHERRQSHDLFPDALPLLARLVGSYRLGLVTNGPPDLQREKVARTGLGTYFDVVLVSTELGIGKPDVRIFHAALAVLGTPPATALMVGDSLARDIAGAKDAGLRAVWVNRHARIAADPHPDAEITTLAELPRVLETLVRS